LDETKILQGKVGEFIITARKKGNDWFVAGLNNSNARTISLDFDFIEKAKFNMTICNDGVNAHNYGSDYEIRQKIFNMQKSLIYPWHQEVDF
jgi:alpha-glucosidase